MRRNREGIKSLFQIRGAQADFPFGGDPRGNPPPVPGIARADGGPEMDMPRGRILLADDDPFIRTVIHKSLCGEFEVVIAKDGPDALALVLRERPDVILLDVALREISGFEVCRSLRTCQFDQPILFLSARLDPAERARGLSLGATAFIAKPLQIREVTERVRAAIRRRRAAPPTSSVSIGLDELLRAARSRSLPQMAFQDRLADVCRDVVRFGASLGIVRLVWNETSPTESIEWIHRELERLTRPEDLLMHLGRAGAVVVLHTEGRAGTVGFVRKLRREWESGEAGSRSGGVLRDLRVGIGVILPARDGRAPTVASALAAAEATDDLFENPLYATDRPIAGPLDRVAAEGTGSL